MQRDMHQALGVGVNARTGFIYQRKGPEKGVRFIKLRLAKELDPFVLALGNTHMTIGTAERHVTGGSSWDKSSASTDLAAWFR